MNDNELMALCLRIARGWSQHNVSRLADYLFRQLRPHIPRRQTSAKRRNVQRRSKRFS